MKEVKDNFSKQAKGYSQFRPLYPNALFDEILSHANDRRSCWDCATGNGQIASVMSDHFNEVVATDISDNQLESAVRKPNIRYLKCRAEQSPFNDDSFDLITVGQAVHWFDFEGFNAEVRRVSKPNGVIAIIGYGLMYVNNNFDALLDKFYHGTIGKYWDPERKHIDSHYDSVPFPFESIEMKRIYAIDVKWSRDQMEGYLNTWSSVNRYMSQNGQNPVDSFVQELDESGVWNEDQRLDVHFPLFIKLGRIRK